jgi:hypothetical protein
MTTIRNKNRKQMIGEVPLDAKNTNQVRHVEPDLCGDDNRIVLIGASAHASAKHIGPR